MANSANMYLPVAKNNSFYLKLTISQLFLQAVSQQTQNICTPFVQRRPNVTDVGPTLYKCYINVLCLHVYWGVNWSRELYDFSHLRVI